jgi:DNA-binding HxlR family transcriptional regulator
LGEPGLATSIAGASVSRALDLIGDRWTLLIIGQAFLGARRFDEWCKRLGIARSTLASRLAFLVKNGLFRKIDTRGHPQRGEYHLTRMGAELHPMGLTSWRWERRWHMQKHTHAVNLVHAMCGHRFEPLFVCGHCHDEVKAAEMAFQPRLAARHDPPAAVRQQRRSIVTIASARGVGAAVGEGTDILGDRWTYLVIAAMFHGARRFDDLHRELGIATNILSDRLKRLVEAEVVERRGYFSNRRRHEYRLTDKGKDLFPIFASLIGWGDKWLAGPNGPPHDHWHRSCGAPLVAQFVCSHCHAELRPRDVVPELGVEGRQSGRKKPAMEK